MITDITKKVNIMCQHSLRLKRKTNVSTPSRSTKMETKSVKSSNVLLYGLSFNLILTLGSLGFTCYSLHRLDTRLTAVEKNLLLTSPPYQLDNRVIVQPTSKSTLRSGSQTKEKVVKRDVNSPPICGKCRRVCFNSNGQRNVGYFYYCVCVHNMRKSSNAKLSFPPW